MGKPDDAINALVVRYGLGTAISSTKLHKAYNRTYAEKRSKGFSEEESQLSAYSAAEQIVKEYVDQVNNKINKFLALREAKVDIVDALAQTIGGCTTTQA